jgi:tRNA dimethylallyltransferase
MAELDSKKTLIVIAGPTAVGKTSLSIELANHFNCPILSFDSRQFYKELSIGTAKPTGKELSQAEHHFIKSRSIDELYTAGMYEQDANERLEELFKKTDYCIAVGGSGLYINALCYGIDDIPSDDKLREKLKNRWQKEGLEVLQKELQAVDPEYYTLGDMKNPRRVMRALEVHHLTGKTYTSYRTATQKERQYNIIWLGLEMDLQELYDRINLRVDKMIDDGLFQEVEGLIPFKDKKALKTVGYVEVLEYFEGIHDKETAVSLIKRNSRRYAKRQFTWFRRNSDIKWFVPTDIENILIYIDSKRRN